MSSPLDGINSDNPENTVSSKYYDLDELQNLKIINNSNSLSLFQSINQSINQSVNQLEFIHINKYIRPELLTIIVGNKLFILPRLIFITLVEDFVSVVVFNFTISKENARILPK